jgi:hypothetical protein
VKLFVEGGGTSNQLKSSCREAFNKFITAAGVNKRPRVVACGSREDAFDSFCVEVKNGKPAMLLVDSEALVQKAYQDSDDSSFWQPWQHLKERPGDGWDKPSSTQDTDCHLMVICMESWFLADRSTLKSFFGQGFHERSLPAENRAIETLPKLEVYESLKKATKPSKKGEYGKGDHSFKLLGTINPTLVIAASPWANRFITTLKKVMQC